MIRTMDGYAMLRYVKTHPLIFNVQTLRMPCTRWTWRGGISSPSTSTTSTPCCSSSGRSSATCPPSTWSTTASCLSLPGPESSGWGEVTPPSWVSSTWGFMSWCTSTTSCPAWGPAYRNISGGKGDLKTRIMINHLSLYLISTLYF